MVIAVHHHCAGPERGVCPNTHPSPCLNDGAIPDTGAIANEDLSETSGAKLQACTKDDPLSKADERVPHLMSHVASRVASHASRASDVSHAGARASQPGQALESPSGGLKQKQNESERENRKRQRRFRRGSFFFMFCQRVVHGEPLIPCTNTVLHQAHGGAPSRAASEASDRTPTSQKCPHA